MVKREPGRPGPSWSAPVPMAYIAGIDVDEARVRVIADTAQAQRERRLPHVAQTHARQRDIDRLADHVIAVRCRLYAVAAKRRVRFRGAVAGKNLERLG